jgi:dolichyl-diphosphooligosaccharide--protein glycosyltransferase
VILLAIFSLLTFLAAVSGGYRRFLLLTGAVVLAGGAGLLIFGPLGTFVSELGSGFLFLRRSGDAWLEFNSELRGVFSRHEFLFTAGYLTAAWFVAPFAFVAALRSWQRGGRRDTGLITFAVWSPLFLLGLILRYVPIAGVIASMGGGYLFSLAWGEGRDTKKRTLLAALALVLFIIPSYPHYKNTVTGSLPAFMRYGLFGRTGVLEWIRDNTPKTSYYLNPVSRPEYGVLTNWDLGARVYQVAERPSMVTAFGWESHGLFEQAGFMVTPHQEIAEKIANENRIRYILLKAFTSLDRSYRVAAEGERKGRLPEGITRGYAPDLSMYRRLFLLDGSSFAASDVLVPSLGNYRLIFETDYAVQGADPGSAVSFFKVFEVVKGARIAGRGKPGATVSLRLPLSTSRGRVFTYHAATKGDREGRYGFTVPYATEGKQGTTAALGEYVVSGDGVKEVKVRVSEADVAEGRTLFSGRR